MPCDARRLLRYRLRAHGDAAVTQALSLWESGEEGGARFAHFRDSFPLDARLWLTAWPFEALLAGERSADSQDEQLPGEPLPISDAAALLALDELFRVDPVGFGLVLDGARGVLDLVAWRHGLGDTDATISERIALALFRYLVLRAGVLARLDDPRERAALSAKRFRHGDGSEFAALRAAREELAEPTLSVLALRELERRGAARAVSLLQADPETGVLLGQCSAFRRALRIDPETEIETAYEQGLFALVARDLEAAAPRGEEAHPRGAELSRFAAYELTTSRRRALVEHLAACSHGACCGLVRAEICGRHAVKRALVGPMSDAPPPAPSHQNQPVNATTPHMIRCRDVLWETFTAMASAEGRQVDELVDEAMDRYRALRSHVAGPVSSQTIPEPAATRRSSIPPSQKAGLRLGGTSSPPLAREPSHPEADEDEVTTPRAPEPSDEPTRPTRG